MDIRAGIPQRASSYHPLSMQTMQVPQYPTYEQSQDAYRTQSAQQLSMSNGPLLPPIQHFDGQAMQTQPQYAAVPMNGAHMQQPPPPYNPAQFHHLDGRLQAVPLPQNMVAPGQNGMVRYPLPPQPLTPGQMMGARHKKDVKRRTKTGCLTCRKRRIKCDEGHPTCNNCRKSKRECLGYDPIFKQSGVPLIQPAPSSIDTQSSNSTTSATTVPPIPYQTPQTFPGTGGTFVPASNPAQRADYGAPLDPALASGDQSRDMEAPNYTLQSARKVKPIDMEQLFSLNDIPPKYQVREAPPPNIVESDVSDFYRHHYASGLDRLFESNWYSSRGLAHLLRDRSLLDFAGQCAERFKSQDSGSVQSNESLEARLVWQLATMPRSLSLTNGAPSEQSLPDLLRRIDVVEHLLTGQFLPQSDIPSPAQQNDYAHDVAQFWHNLGRFASVHDDGSRSSSGEDISETLSAVRGILGRLENRDVLYSLAIARHFGGRLDEFRPRHRLVTSQDPNDDIFKIEVARGFVQHEDQKGTTQVVQRICGMAMRSWTLQKQ